MHSKSDLHSRNNICIFRIYVKLGFYTRRILCGLLISFMWLWEICSLPRFSLLFLWMDGCFQKNTINFIWNLLGQKLHHAILYHTRCIWSTHIWVYVCIHFIHTYTSFRIVQVPTISVVFQLLVVLPKFNQPSWNLSC